MSLNRFISMTLTRTLLAAAASSLAVLSLAACASDPKTKSLNAAAATPLDLHPLKAAPAIDKIALALHEGGLSPAQAEAVNGIAARRAQDAGGVVTISLPHGAADAAVAGQMADRVQAQLNIAGAPAERTVYESNDPKAPLLVSYGYEKAEIETCGKDWGDLTKSRDNLVYGNFGCAVHANMAAQIANPSDIVHPHTEDSVDVQRRLTVLDKYRAGKTTSAEEPQAKGAGAIAHVGQ
jgi:pilus assembly protein CpaD